LSGQQSTDILLDNNRTIFTMPGLKLQQGLPTWLGDGSAVQSLLSNPPSTYESSSAQTAVPRRTVAMRETDVFVAVGKEIRCADLKDFKAQSERGMEADYKVSQFIVADNQMHFKG